MHDIADRYYPTVNDVVEPHQNSGNQKKYSAAGDGPKIKFLPSVEESSIFRRECFRIFNISLDLADPPSVRTGPVHWRKPVQELKEKEDVEEQAEPWMKESRHCPTAKERCEPAIKRRRIDRKSGKKRKAERDSDAPMQDPSINRMAQ